MRKLLAIWVAKILMLVSKLMGKQGTSMPGAVALKICPNILRDLAGQVQKIIVVCGTNGKTSTNNLIYAVLKRQVEKREKIVCNRIGANMLPGVACAFADAANIFGRVKARFASLEVDEFSVPKVFEHIQPNFMLITNISPDQTDRFGSVDKVACTLFSASQMHDDCKLILNADDELVASIGGDGAYYFGKNNKVKLQTAKIHRHNVLAAYKALKLLGADVSVMQEVLDEYVVPAGRMQEFNIDGKKFIFNLVKNPAGFDYVISNIAKDKSKKTIVIGVNNNAGDGVDTSWLGAVDFGRLNAHKIIATGMCKEVLIEQIKKTKAKSALSIQEVGAVRSALEMARGLSPKTVYVLMNYTLIFETEKRLKKMRKKYGA